ncbi:MAG: hypothetical protein QM778_28045 [Myxococcales bacterium]
MPPQQNPAVEAAASSATADVTPTDAQLAALMAQEEAPAEAEDEPFPVQVYGFADAGYRQLFVEKNNPWLLFLNRHPSMFVGNLNVYLDAKMGSKWRSLVEVRLTYLPQGAPDTSLQTEDVQRQQTRTPDYTDFSRSKTLGGIMIERAYIEYAAFSWLSFKAGQWLTPYGIWNVDHGSPVIIGVSRPFIIGGELMPEHQLGLLADGSVPLGDNWELSYMGAVSNGRMDRVPYEDMDNNKAITGRAALTWRKYGQMTLGGTAYVGSFSDTINQLVVQPNGAPTSREKIKSQYDETTYAVDYRWLYKGLHLQAEWIVNDRKYTSHGRPTGPDGGLIADRRNSGGYALLGYRTPWLTIMPYGKAEITPDPQMQAIGIHQKIALLTGGINVRPRPNVVLKAEYVYAFFPSARPNTFESNNIRGLDLQIAWQF